MILDVELGAMRVEIAFDLVDRPLEIRQRIERVQAIVEEQLIAVAVREHVEFGVRGRQHDADHEQHDEADHRPAPMAQCARRRIAIALCMRVMMFLRPMNFGGGRLADSIGTRLTATSHEARCAIAIATATWVRKMLMLSFSPNTIGRNTMMLDSVPAAIAMPTTCVPWTAQYHGLSGYRSR